MILNSQRMKGQWIWQLGLSPVRDQSMKSKIWNSRVCADVRRSCGTDQVSLQRGKTVSVLKYYERVLG